MNENLDERIVLEICRAAAEKLALEVRELREIKKMLEQRAGHYDQLLDEYERLVAENERLVGENERLAAENENLSKLTREILANANTIVDSPVTEILDPAETQILDGKVMYGLVSEEAVTQILDAQPEKKPRRCRNCGKPGHDNRNCPTRKTKRVRRCGNCGQTGHDKRKCSI